MIHKKRLFVAGNKIDLQEPIPLALTMAAIAKSLAREAAEWYYYEKKMLALSDQFSEYALALLQESYRYHTDMTMTDTY